MADTGTVTITSRSSGNPRLGNLACRTITWLSDGDGNCTLANIGGIAGTVELVSFRPNTDSGTQPTDGYDITLTDSLGFDVLGGAGTDLSNSVSKHFRVPAVCNMYTRWDVLDGGTLIRRGKGKLNTVCITKPATTAGIVTVYDSLTGSTGDTIIAELYICDDSVYFSPTTLELNASYTNGIYLSPDGTVDAGSICLTYAPDVFPCWIGPLDLAVSNAGATSIGYIDVFFRK